jgi:hypothetical protein
MDTAVKLVENSSCAMFRRTLAAGLGGSSFVQTSTADHPFVGSGRKKTPGMLSLFTVAGASETPIPAALGGIGGRHTYFLDPHLSPDPEHSNQRRRSGDAAMNSSRSPIAVLFVSCLYIAVEQLDLPSTCTN